MKKYEVADLTDQFCQEQMRMQAELVSELATVTRKYLEKNIVCPLVLGALEHVKHAAADSFSRRAHGQQGGFAA